MKAHPGPVSSSGTITTLRPNRSTCVTVCWSKASSPTLESAQMTHEQETGSITIRSVDEATDEIRRRSKGTAYSRLPGSQSTHAQGPGPSDYLTDHMSDLAGDMRYFQV
ncbi:hypothetical protein Misp02_28860 [Microtetraspora sp. NBRC 16547]|nr:hypothetical protein Misp02_28860 [Microtetraspora sp. NBRC 16547]